MVREALTRPERAAQIRQAKRYRAAINRRGRCCACVHRDRENTYWGRNICSIGDNRQYPQCEQDGRGKRFTFDDTVLSQFQDREKAA